MGKKKRPGHYCYICGTYKANEKFSGSGHARHVCKECAALPQEKKNELQYINRIGRIADKYPRSRADWDLLEKYAKNNKYPEAREFAGMILEMSGRRLSEKTRKYEKIPEVSAKVILFSELDEEIRQEVEEDIYESIYHFILQNDYIPEGKHRQKILDRICKDISTIYGDCLKADDELMTLFDATLKVILDELHQEGIIPGSYLDSLTMMETERLVIRKFIRDDMDGLYAIMQKPEVMYAWEHGFSKSETRKWLNRQLTRYRKDGYGYFAVVLKETGKLIGQAGLLKNTIGGKEEVELGYLFDNTYWKQGFCQEAVTACIEFAFKEQGLDVLHCSIRPENMSSIRIAEKIGMIQTGEHIVNYQDKDMLHLIYVLEKEI